MRKLTRSPWAYWFERVPSHKRSQIHYVMIAFVFHGKILYHSTITSASPAVLSTGEQGASSPCLKAKLYTIFGKVYFPKIFRISFSFTVFLPPISRISTAYLLYLYYSFTLSYLPFKIHFCAFTVLLPHSSHKFTVLKNQCSTLLPAYFPCITSSQSPSQSATMPTMKSTWKPLLNWAQFSETCV